MKPASLQSTKEYAVAWALLLLCSQTSQAHGPDCRTVGKKETAGWETTVKNHSDVFIDTSSILKIHVVERMRQKMKIAFVVRAVPKR